MSSNVDWSCSRTNEPESSNAVDTGAEEDNAPKEKTPVTPIRLGHERTKDTPSSPSAPSMKRQYAGSETKPDEDTGKQASPPKKLRVAVSEPDEPEIQPRIRNLRLPPPRPNRKIWHRDENRREALRKSREVRENWKSRASSSDFGDEHTIESATLSPLYYDSSAYHHASENNYQQPVEPYPELVDAPAPEYYFDGPYYTPWTITHADGSLSLDLNRIGYCILPSLDEAIQVHEKFVNDVKTTIRRDIETFVRLHPRYAAANDEEQANNINRLQHRQVQSYVDEWREQYENVLIPFRPPMLPNSLCDLVALAVARAGMENPLPVGCRWGYEAVQRHVEMVQRMALEEHRAHNQWYIYYWRRKAVAMIARQ